MLYLMMLVYLCLFCCCFNHLKHLFLCLGIPTSNEPWREMRSTPRSWKDQILTFPSSLSFQARVCGMWPRHGQSDVSTINIELGADGARNRDGQEALSGEEILWQYPVSCGSISRVLTGWLPCHGFGGDSGYCVFLCLCWFSKLVFQTPWRFLELPNIFSINSFSARIIQNWVFLLLTKNSG